MSINYDTLLTDSGGRAIFEKILDTKFLMRVKFAGGLLQKAKAYGLSKPMPTGTGAYWELTRKQHIRLPSTDPMTSGASGDPLSGATLGVDKVLLPIESHREYVDIDVLTPLISWIPIEEWVENDMAKVAWPRQANRLLQAALLNGRMTPGVYAADGTISTPFFRTAAASLTRGGITFTFTKFPRVFGRGRDSFADIQTDDYLSWAVIEQSNIRLSNSGAPMIDGSEGPGYVAVVSRAQWSDLLRDNDDGRLLAIMQSGKLKAVIDGVVGLAVFFYKDTYFVIEPDPYTMNAGDDVARAEWGSYHVGHMFGQEAFAYTQLGKLPNGGKTGTGMFKVTDTTKTGATYSIGWRGHWNCRCVNENWGVNLITPVRVSKPNNYNPTNKQLHGGMLE